MKCIHCGSDTKFTVRTGNGGRCGACSHPFAFEPKPDPLSITDGLFQRVLKDVGGENTVFFTERQLWYEFNRRLLRKRFWRHPYTWIAGGSTVGGLAVAMALTNPLAMGLGICGLAVAWGLNHRANKRTPLPPAPPKVPFPQFRSGYLDKWVRAHAPIEKLLPPPPGKSSLPPQTAPPDVTAFSFDRAVVTDNAEIAAMLVANNFHFENNCAILSEDGYPEHIAPTVLEMLRRNPQLTVFAVHDASIRGCMLPHTLRGDRWFPDTGIRIIDLGLRPQHAEQMGLIRPQGATETCPPTLRALLSPEEIAWLESGNTSELAALRPARLMRAIYQGFARANQAPGTDSSDGVADGSGGVWIHSPGADVYAADSFG